MSETISNNKLESNKLSSEQLTELVLHKETSLDKPGIGYSTFARLHDESFEEKLEGVIEHGLIGARTRFTSPKPNIQDLRENHLAHRVVWFNVTGKRVDGKAFQKNERKATTDNYPHCILNRASTGYDFMEHFLEEKRFMLHSSGLGEHTLSQSIGRLANQTGLINVNKAKEIIKANPDGYPYSEFQVILKEYFENAFNDQLYFESLPIENQKALEELFVILPHKAFFTEEDEYIKLRMKYMNLDEIDVWHEYPYYWYEKADGEVSIKSATWSGKPITNLWEYFEIDSYLSFWKRQGVHRGQCYFIRFPSRTEIGSCKWVRGQTENSTGSNLAHTVTALFDVDNKSQIPLNKYAQITKLHESTDHNCFPSDPKIKSELVNKYWADTTFFDFNKENLEFDPKNNFDPSQNLDRVCPIAGYALAPGIPKRKIKGWVITMSNGSIDGKVANCYLDFLPNNPLQTEIDKLVATIAEKQLRLYKNRPELISPIYNGITGDMLWPAYKSYDQLLELEENQT